VLHLVFQRLRKPSRIARHQSKRPVPSIETASLGVSFKPRFLSWTSLSTDSLEDVTSIGRRMVRFS